MNIVFIHGRKQEGKNPEELKAFWIEHFKQGFQKEDVKLPDNIKYHFPFYGDTLIEHTNQRSAPRGGENDAFLDFKTEFYAELLEQQNIVPKEDNSLDRGVLNWEWVQKILAKLDSDIPAISDGTLKKFTSDVYTYLSDPDARTAVDDIVKKHLVESKNTIIISHSLGTVVAYNLLRELANSHIYPLHITLGSPLGVRAIQRLLETPLVYPNLLDKWTNIFDPKDVVALYPLDSDNFNLEPHQRYIENICDVKNTTDNHHSIEGYIGNPYVIKTLVRTIEGLSCQL